MEDPQKCEQVRPQERLEKGWVWKVYKLRDVWLDKWVRRKEDRRGKEGEGGRKDG